MARTTPIGLYHNTGIVTYVDASKTTTTERIFSYIGVNHKVGGVHDGVATIDQMVQEQERGITIAPTVAATFWQGSTRQFPHRYRFNIIDIPGHAGFTIEVERSLRMLGDAVVVLSGADRVEPQPETAQRQTNRCHMPYLAYMSKMDCQGADSLRVVAQTKQRLGHVPVPIQLAIGAEEDFNGQIDLVKMKAIYWNDDNQGTSYREGEISAELRALVEEWQTHMVEAAAEANDELINKYLEGEELSIEGTRAGPCQQILVDRIVPVVLDSSFRNKDVPLVLDAVIDYLPVLSETPAIRDTGPDDEEKHDGRHANDDEPFLALAFKVTTDPFVGILAFARVYSGVLTPSDVMLSSVKDKEKQIGRMVQMHINQRGEIKEVHTGDITALIGTGDVTTGDALCAISKPVILERMDFPDPVISVAVELKTKIDQEKMGITLSKLAQENPLFRVKTDERTAQTIISEMGELHLDIIVDRIRHEFGAEANIGKPQVAYRETIRNTCKVKGKFVRQSDGRDQFGHCWIHFAPADKGQEGLGFHNEVAGGVTPQEFIPVIQKGIEDQMRSGVLAGYPLVGSKTAMYDGSYHSVDSSEMVFKIVAPMATKQLSQKDRAVLLESVMKVETTTSEDYVSNVTDGLSCRHGLIQGVEDTPAGKMIRAGIPLGEMFDYTTDVRSMSQGHASYSAEFIRYVEVPASMTEAIVVGQGR